MMLFFSYFNSSLEDIQVWRIYKPWTTPDLCHRGCWESKWWYWSLCMLFLYPSLFRLLSSVKGHNVVSDILMNKVAADTSRERGQHPGFHFFFTMGDNAGETYRAVRSHHRNSWFHLFLIWVSLSCRILGVFNMVLTSVLPTSRCVAM